MLTRSSERISNLGRYTGNIYIYKYMGWGTFVEETFVESTFVEGTLVERNIGRTEHSSNRTFVEQNIRLKEHLSNGTFV